MKRDDMILKYLADLMTETEKNDFEKELSLSEELRKDLAKQKDLLGSLNGLADVKEDSPYFQNLLPNVRAKLEKRKRTVWVSRFAYLIPTATAVILIVMNIGRFSPDNSLQNKEVNKSETASKSNLDATALTKLTNEYNVKSDIELAGTKKGNNISFEVGIGYLSGSNEESIKELANYQRTMQNIDENILAYNSGK